MPKISVLTPSYNQCEFIEQNILSVLDQDYPSFEHIVVDGGSTDGTVEILKRYPHLIWVSGKDGGRADALDEGFTAGDGRYRRLTETSDDYPERRIFRELVPGFSRMGTRCSGRYRQGYEGFAFRREASCQMRGSSIWRASFGTPICSPDQPGFYRRALIASAGDSDPSLDMVMDYYLWLRLATNAAYALIDWDFGVFSGASGAKRRALPDTRRQNP